MESDTGKGQRGKRGVLRLPKDARQGEGAPNLDNGDGQVSGVGLGAPAEHRRPVTNWLEFVHIVNVAHKHYKNQIRTVWHPEPLFDSIYTDHCNIAVKIGPVKAQLNTAQFVDL